MNRPVIGITKPLQGGKISFLLIWLNIWLAGGKPVALTAIKPEYNFQIHGLVLGGGKDIFPEYYGGQVKPPSYLYDKARDNMEFTWFYQSEKAGLPILGICRGAQLINVARKGTLHFDVRKAYEKADYPSGLWAKVFFRKGISVSKDSLLYRILRMNRTQVNSSHTQCIDKLGENLIITSIEANQVIQSVEDPHYSFLLGVQFHPEFLAYAKKFRNIFKEFVLAVKRQQN